MKAEPGVRQSPFYQFLAWIQWEHKDRVGGASQRRPDCGVQVGICEEIVVYDRSGSAGVGNTGIGQNDLLADISRLVGLRAEDNVKRLSEEIGGVLSNVGVKGGAVGRPNRDVGVLVKGERPGAEDGRASGDAQAAGAINEGITTGFVGVNA